MADALLLPPPLAGDERFQALGQLAARISDIDLSPLLVYLVDTVNASALPNLAEQLHILGEGWQFARNDAERRRMIKRAVELHRYKGTPWAIREIVRRLGFGEVQILEGLGNLRHDGRARRNGIYTYGEPDRWAHYRIQMNAPITNDQAALLRQTLAAFAPARCILAALDFTAVALRHNGRAVRDGRFNRGTA